MSAVIEADGTRRQLDGSAEPPAIVTAEDVQDAEKLARMVQSLQREVAEMKRRFNPHRLFFRNVAFDGTGVTRYRLNHGFGKPVVWRVAGSPDIDDPDVQIKEHASSDADTLVLVSYTEMTATVEVEESG